MIGNLEALEVINRQRYNFLKSTCMENGGTIADWKITNFLKDDLFLYYQKRIKLSLNSWLTDKNMPL